MLEMLTTVGVVNWKVLLALGVAGGVAYAVLRKKRNMADDDELWAKAEVHIKESHPEMIGMVRREDILAQAELV